jgi:hypothetical protein
MTSKSTAPSTTISIGVEIIESDVGGPSYYISINPIHPSPEPTNQNLLSKFISSIGISTQKPIDPYPSYIATDIDRIRKFGSQICAIRTKQLGEMDDISQTDELTEDTEAARCLRHVAELVNPNRTYSVPQADDIRRDTLPQGEISRKAWESLRESAEYLSIVRTI